MNLAWGKELILNKSGMVLIEAELHEKLKSVCLYHHISEIVIESMKTKINSVCKNKI